MLMEKISNASNSLAAKILLGFIAVTFVLSGAAGYMFSSADTYAVKVNGQEISQQLFQQRYNDAYQQVSQRLGNQFAVLADTPDFNQKLRNEVLNQLIDQTLLRQYAEELKLGISKRQIETAIVTTPEFKKDGKFDNDIYLQTLQLNGLSPNYYAEIVRDNLRLNQLQNGFLGSSFLTPSLSQSLAQDFFQTRLVRFATFPVDKAMEGIQVTEAEIADYYASHTQDFTIPEQVKVQYIDLNHNEVMKNLAISDVQIAQYYQDNKTQFVQQRLSHIQVASETEAEKLYQELNSGANFADLAKEYSQDTLSAKNGGDLNWVVSGMMPKAFEETALKLSAGEYSAPVKIDNAYHIIKVDEEREMPLSDVKEEILAKLRNEMAINAFYSTEKKLNDKAFETPESLTAVGEALDLPVHETAMFSRQNVPEALNYANVLSALFDSDLTQGEINSEAINVGDQHSIVVRVLAHKVAGVQSLAEAKAEIMAQLKLEKAQAEVFAQAEKQAQALNEGKENADALAFGPEETLTYADQSNLAFNQAIFAMPKPLDGKALFKALKTSDGNVKIVELLSVKNGELNAKQQALFNQQMDQVQKSVLNLTLLKALRAQAEIKINEEFMQSEQ